MVGVIPEIRIFSELSVFAVPALGLIVYNRFRSGIDGMIIHTQHETMLPTIPLKRE